MYLPSLCTRIDVYTYKFIVARTHHHFLICRFLRILKLLVQDPAGADKAFLPSVISFVMSQIHPLISEQQNSDILLVLYELFYQLLLNNWRYVLLHFVAIPLLLHHHYIINNIAQHCTCRYFFPGSVLLHMDSDETAEPIEHEVEFFNIMEVGKTIALTL